MRTFTVLLIKTDGTFEPNFQYIRAASANAADAAYANDASFSDYVVVAVFEGDIKPT